MLDITKDGLGLDDGTLDTSIVGSDEGCEDNVGPDDERLDGMFDITKDGYGLADGAIDASTPKYMLKSKTVIVGEIISRAFHRLKMDERLEYETIIISLQRTHYCFLL